MKRARLIRCASCGLTAMLIALVAEVGCDGVPVPWPTDPGPFELPAGGVSATITVNPFSGGTYQGVIPLEGILEGKIAIFQAEANDGYGNLATTWRWEQLYGPPVELRGADTASVSFRAPDVDADTEVGLQVVATISGRGSGTAQAKVTVYDTATKLPPPRASASWTVTRDGQEYWEDQGQTAEAGDIVTLKADSGEEYYEYYYEYGIQYLDSGVVSFYYYSNGQVEQFTNRFLYSWRQTGPLDAAGGPALPVTLAGDDTSRASFIAPPAADVTTLSFELTVTDAIGRTDAARPAVTLGPLPMPQPFVYFQSGSSVARSRDTVTLHGDPGGTVTQVEWSQDPLTPNPQLTLVLNGPEVSFVVPCMVTSQSVLINYTVTDALGRSATATKEITLQPRGTPYVWASYSGYPQVGQPFTLTSDASTDDPGPLLYAWAKLAGGAGDFPGGTDHKDVVFTPAEQGSFVFQVTVCDSCGVEETATVTVQIY